MSDHRGVPINPDARGDFGRPRRTAICEVCKKKLRRVSILRGSYAPRADAPAYRIGERRTEWHHFPERKRS